MVYTLNQSALVINIPCWWWEWHALTCDRNGGDGVKCGGSGTAYAWGCINWVLCIRVCVCVFEFAWARAIRPGSAAQLKLLLLFSDMRFGVCKMCVCVYACACALQFWVGGRGTRRPVFAVACVTLTPFAAKGGRQRVGEMRAACAASVWQPMCVCLGATRTRCVALRVIWIKCNLLHSIVCNRIASARRSWRGAVRNSRIILVVAVCVCLCACVRVLKSAQRERERATESLMLTMMISDATRRLSIFTYGVVA